MCPRFWGSQGWRWPRGRDCQDCPQCHPLVPWAGGGPGVPGWPGGDGSVVPKAEAPRKALKTKQKKKTLVVLRGEDRELRPDPQTSPNLPHLAGDRGHRDGLGMVPALCQAPRCPQEGPRCHLLVPRPSLTWRHPDFSGSHRGCVACPHPRLPSRCPSREWGKVWSLPGERQTGKKKSREKKIPEEKKKNPGEKKKSQECRARGARTPARPLTCATAGATAPAGCPQPQGAGAGVSSSGPAPRPCPLSKPAPVSPALPCHQCHPRLPNSLCQSPPGSPSCNPPSCAL